MKKKKKKIKNYDKKYGLPSDRFIDAWRFHLVNDSTWKIDNKGGTVDPTDEYINKIDGIEKEELSSPIPPINMLNVLPPRLKDITERYVFNGESMISIGKDYGLTRIRIFQLYKQSILLLKDAFEDNPDMIRYLLERNE